MNAPSKLSIKFSLESFASMTEYYHSKPARPLLESPNVAGIFLPIFSGGLEMEGGAA